MWILAACAPEAVTPSWYQESVECVGDVAEWTVPDPMPFWVTYTYERDGYPYWASLQGQTVENGHVALYCANDIVITYGVAGTPEE